ncbi:hypothetical protein GCM10008982_12330 [Anoxybacillus voinovskiensis]|nr:hypothetical protein GCM10008982_12330 [Anoxybacillus voinovskiensis]
METNARRTSDAKNDGRKVRYFFGNRTKIRAKSTEMVIVSKLLDVYSFVIYDKGEGNNNTEENRKGVGKRVRRKNV